MARKSAAPILPPSSSLIGNDEEVLDSSGDVDGSAFDEDVGEDVAVGDAAAEVFADDSVAEDAVADDVVEDAVAEIAVADFEEDVAEDVAGVDEDDAAGAKDASFDVERVSDDLSEVDTSDSGFASVINCTSRVAPPM